MRGDIDGGCPGFQDADDRIRAASLYIAGRRGPMFADAVDGDELEPEEEWGLGPDQDVAHPTVIVGLSAIGLRFLAVRPDADQVVFLAWLGLLIGAFLIGYAVFLFGRKNQPESAVLDKIETRLHSAQPWEFTALGLGLNLRPKAILVAVTAGALIGVRELPLLQGTLLVLAFAAVAQTGVVVPIAAWLRSPERAEVTLTSLDTWLQRNGRTIVAIKTLGVGLFIAGFCIARL